ncbi:MAG: hypothetical protein HDR22_10560 [Lachnospiraceae bacterium]|nr:hypothetical protein [Lachnospiraceae bacterium]
MRYYRKLWKHEKYFYILFMIAYIFLTIAVCNALKRYKDDVSASPYPLFTLYVLALEFLKNYSKNNKPARNFIRTLPVKQMHMVTFHSFLGILVFLPSMFVYLVRIMDFEPLLKKEILLAMIVTIMFFIVVQIIKLILKKEFLALAVAFCLYLCAMGKMWSILVNVWDYIYYGLW